MKITLLSTLSSWSSLPFIPLSSSLAATEINEEIRYKASKRKIATH